MGRSWYYNSRLEMSTVRASIVPLCDHGKIRVHRARKAGAPAADYLSHFALACHRADAAVGGALVKHSLLSLQRIELAKEQLLDAYRKDLVTYSTVTFSQPALR